jgi:hypothetical protein
MIDVVNGACSWNAAYIVCPASSGGVFEFRTWRFADD